MSAVITVIIPTLGRRRRELARAIDSLKAQKNVDVLPLVVVNGKCFEPAIVQWLDTLPDIRVIKTPVVGVSRARFLGRQLVDTPCFAFLDDDDELLPEAMEIRLGAMRDSQSDVVVTNGYLEQIGVRNRVYQHFSINSGNLLCKLLEQNWLDPAGGLYRTETVTDEIFSALPGLMEWTWLAYLLVSGGFTVKSVNMPTYVRHIGAEDQATRSWDYMKSVSELLGRIEEHSRDAGVSCLIRNKMANAYHECATKALIDGDVRHAWDLHTKCLQTGNGYRFLSFTRYFLMPGRLRQGASG